MTPLEQTDAPIVGTGLLRRSALRLARAAGVAFWVMVIAFGLIRLAPGDPVLARLGAEAAPAAIEKMRVRLRSLPNKGMGIKVIVIAENPCHPAKAIPECLPDFRYIPDSATALQLRNREEIASQQHSEPIQTRAFQPPSAT